MIVNGKQDGDLQGQSNGLAQGSTVLTGLI